MTTRNRSEHESDVHELSMSDVLHELSVSRLRVLGIILGVFSIAVVYVVLAPRIYKADALFQLEKREVREGAITEITSEFGSETTIPAEISVIKSRAVLGRVVDELGLELKVENNLPPLIGKTVTSGWHADTAYFPKWVSRYVGTEEKITIRRFDVPGALKGMPFAVVAGGDNSFSLYDEDGRFLGNGQVGAPVSLPVNGSTLTIDVAEMVCHGGGSFFVTRQSRAKAIADLQKKLVVAEEGKESGIIRISLEGEDREQIAKVVGAIAVSYVDFQRASRSEEMDRTLAILEAQLPVLEREAKNAEAAIRGFQNENGSVNLPLETNQLLSESVRLQTEISALERERDRYADGHPSRQGLDRDIAAMERELRGVKSRVNRLPQLQQKFMELSRAASVNAELYARLMNNVQELRVVKAATLSDIRIIDKGDASPEPIRPMVALTLALGLLIGFFAALVSAVVRRVMRGPSHDPTELERQLGLPVYVALPYAKQQKMLESGRGDGKSLVLAHSSPTDVAVECLRSLRAWINTSAFKRTNNALLITGPSQGVGKTFVSMNLAAVLASSGRRVLLVDADLRKGNLHKRLGAAKTPGLSELLEGRVSDFPQTCHSVDGKGFYLLPKGAVNGGSSELLMSERFRQAISLAINHFDDVIIDSPPILAVSDAVVIGQQVGSALLVVREGINSAEELEEATKRLQSAGVPLRGVVFNALKTKHARYSYQYRGYEQQWDAD